MLFGGDGGDVDVWPLPLGLAVVGWYVMVPLKFAPLHVDCAADVDVLAKFGTTQPTVTYFWRMNGVPPVGSVIVKVTVYDPKAEYWCCGLAVVSGADTSPKSHEYAFAPVEVLVKVTVNGRLPVIAVPLDPPPSACGAEPLGMPKNPATGGGVGTAPTVTVRDVVDDPCVLVTVKTTVYVPTALY
jgi:hypothetical protein